MTVSDREIDNLLSNIIKLHPKSIDLGLSRTMDLLEKLDNPHNRFAQHVQSSSTNMRDMMNVAFGMSETQAQLAELTENQQYINDKNINIAHEHCVHAKCSASNADKPSL